MKESNKFSVWFKKVTQCFDPQQYLKFVSPQDILQWSSSTHTTLTNISLKKASELTKQYQQHQKNSKIQNLFNKNKNEDQENQEEILCKKFTHKPCFLNGYPAKIQKTKNNQPIIFNQYTFVTIRSWKYVSKNYPHFTGGKIYNPEDTIKIIQQKIKKEEKRPLYIKKISSSSILKIDCIL